MNEQEEKGLFTFYKQQQQQEKLLAKRKRQRKNKNGKSKSKSKSKKKLKIKNTPDIKFETIKEINQQEVNENSNKKYDAFLKNIKIKNKSQLYQDRRKSLRTKTQPQESQRRKNMQTLPQNDKKQQQHRISRINSQKTSQQNTKYKNLSQVLQKCKEDFYPNKQKIVFKKYDTSNSDLSMEKIKTYQFNGNSNLLKIQQQGIDIKKYLLSKVQHKNKIYVSHAINSIFKKKQNDKNLNDLLMKSPVKLPVLIQKIEERYNQNVKNELQKINKDKNRQISFKRSKEKLKNFFKVNRNEQQSHEQTNQNTLNLINMSEMQDDNNKNIYDSFEWKQKRKIIRQIFGKQL